MAFGLRVYKGLGFWFSGCGFEGLGSWLSGLGFSLLVRSTADGCDTLSKVNYSLKHKKTASLDSTLRCRITPVKQTSSAIYRILHAKPKTIEPLTRKPQTLPPSSFQRVVLLSGKLQTLPRLRTPDSAYSYSSYSKCAYKRDANAYLDR